MHIVTLTCVNEAYFFTCCHKALSTTWFCVNIWVIDDMIIAYDYFPL